MLVPPSHATWGTSCGLRTRGEDSQDGEFILRVRIGERGERMGDSQRGERSAQDTL